MSGSPKMTKRLPLPVLARVSPMCRSAFMRGLEDGQGAELVELGGVGLEVEGAGDEHVEAGVAGLAGGPDEVLSGDGAELGADDDAGAAFGAVLAFGVAALGADELAGPRVDRRERDAVGLVGLLHAAGREVAEGGGGEVLRGAVGGCPFGGAVDQLVGLVEGEQAVGRQALDGEGAGDADALRVVVRPVVEVLHVGARRDGSVDLLLAGDAGLPPEAGAPPWPRAARDRTGRSGRSSSV